MSKSDVFHLGLTKNDLQGATLAIVPGDPERVEKIAALMEKPVKLASHREFTTWRAELDGKAIIVCSTGIGGPVHLYCGRGTGATGYSYFPAYRHHWRYSAAYQRGRCAGHNRVCTSGRSEPALCADGVPGPSPILNVRLRWLKRRNPWARPLTLALLPLLTPSIRVRNVTTPSLAASFVVSKVLWKSGNRWAS
ncbi:uridine phosphorylase [Citrobacter koseri]|uniref:Uridine phosphorylase n=1 Tax=Citrobacter koseri TaxID=545 RepID=A0A2X2YT15_CITKO|nr:uridine phosphorylase [Citrobacter koseri]